MGLLDRIQSSNIENNGENESNGNSKSNLMKNDDNMHKVKQQIHEILVEKLGQEMINGTIERDLVTREIIDTINRLRSEIKITIGKSETHEIINDLCNEVFGLGPIEPYVRDNEITEIMVNGPSKIYIEKNGLIELTNCQFRDESHVHAIIERIVSPIGRRIDESNPMVDARLKDGSRVNAIIPPLSLSGPCLTIRKFSKDPFTAEDLISFGTLTPETTAFLEACVKSRLNCLVTGGTGSGKTTTLNVLSSFIPENERIVTVEDAAEIQLRQEHVVTLESRPPNIEGKGEIKIRELVRNCLRMRPDRIVVGEVRGGEALDMLQAMNTGHDGSLTTAHSNSPRDALSRIETMVLMAGIDLPLKAIREQITSAIDMIIHQERMKDGKRRITYITEVVGMENDTITLQDIFVFEKMGTDENNNIIGKIKPTGIVPKAAERIKSSGIKIPMSVFGSPIAR